MRSKNRAERRARITFLIFFWFFDFFEFFFFFWKNFEFCILLFFQFFLLVQVLDHRYRFPVVRNYFWIQIQIEFCSDFRHNGSPHLIWKPVQQPVWLSEIDSARGGNHQTNCGRHGVGMDSVFFWPNWVVFRWQAMAIPLKATGGVNTTPIPRTRRNSAHVIFLAWLKIWFIKSTGNISVSKNSHLHIQRAMSYAQSLLIPPCFTSSAYSTHISNLSSLLFVAHGDDHCDEPQHFATFGPLAEPQLLAGHEPNDLISTKVLPQTEHDSDLWFSWELCDSPPESDLDDMLASTLFLQEREKQVPTDHEFITPTEKTQCQVHRTSEQVQGDCCSVLTQKKVKSRITLRQRRYFLGTSSSSRRKWSSIQTLWIGKCCESCSWRTKRSSTRRGKSWSIEARMWSRLSWLFHSWTSKTNSFQPFGNWLWRSWMRRISKRAVQASRSVDATWKSTSRNSHSKYSWSGRIEEGSGSANWRILQAWIERKSGYYTRALLTNTGVARKSDPFERFYRIPRCGIDLQWKNFPRSHSTGSDSKSLWCAEPRPKPVTWYMVSARKTDRRGRQIRKLA